MTSDSAPTVEIRTFGKCIIVGEHAVLRGHPAVVYPFRGKSFVLRYRAGDRPLQVTTAGDFGREAQLVFHSLLEKAVSKVGRSPSEIRGEIEIENTIAVGAGLGASAALCVGVGRLLSRFNWLEPSGIYDFARELEDMFHGESSGVDIATALFEKPLIFVRGEKPQVLEAKWTPHWYLSYSGQRGITADCVRQVKTLWAKEPLRAVEIDREMRVAVDDVILSLRSEAPERKLRLAQALHQARHAFEKWGLAEGSLLEHMKVLDRSGALSYKPTGSGGGGHVLSLWESRPPENVISSLGLMPLGF